MAPKADHLNPHCGGHVAHLNGEPRPCQERPHSSFYIFKAASGPQTQVQNIQYAYQKPSSYYLFPAQEINSRRAAQLFGGFEVVDFPDQGRLINGRGAAQLSKGSKVVNFPAKEMEIDSRDAAQLFGGFGVVDFPDHQK